MKYEYGIHVFTDKQRTWHVTLCPDGRAYVNKEPVCVFELPNTTKTRALVALKNYLENQKKNES